MARPPRINLAGGLFHVIQRGNNRQAIFLTDEDRHAFLKRLAHYTQVCDCRIHAYCLMENHLHLLVETRRANLSLFGQRLFASYTLWFNRRHERVGHVLQGRFKSILVERDPYLLHLSRYIHVNPVKAGLVRRPEQYRWSSLGTYLPSRDGQPSWVVTDETLSYFDGDRRRYLDFVSAGLAAPFQPTPVHQAFLGSETFVDTMRSTQARVVEIPARDRPLLKDRVIRVVCAMCRVSVAATQQRYSTTPAVLNAQALIAYLLHQYTSFSYSAIGRLVGRVTKSTIMRRIQLVERTPELKAQAAQLKRDERDA